MTPVWRSVPPPRTRRARIVAPELVTLADMYAYLKLPAAADGSPSATDARLQEKIDAATALICNYITDRQPDDPIWTAEVEDWTPDTAPPEILVAIQAQTAQLFRFTGEDPAASDKQRDRGFLSNDVYNLIMRYRDPTVA